MLINQISAFLPNQKGSLSELTGILMEHKIDIRALSIYDTTEFGILRMVVDDPDKTVEILKNEGIVAKVSQVLALEPEDKPGALHEVFTILKENDLNVEYVYSFTMNKNEMPYFILRTDDQQRAADVLVKNGIKVIHKNEVYGL